MSLSDDSIIEDLTITPENNNMSLHRKLPDGIVGTKTVLYYNVMAAHAVRSQGVNSEHLAKVWRISNEEAERTLEVTRQGSVHTPDSKLAKNYGTNDRMIRYKHFNEYFYMDTLKATEKGGKSTWGNLYCQLFVTDRGFLYVVPMKSRSEVILAVKQFAKDIGVPDAIICDASGEQSSIKLRQFCQEIVLLSVI